MRRRPERKEPRSGAIVAALSLPDQRYGPEDRLDELSRLLASLGIETLGTVVQRRAAPDPASLIGRGKAEEIRLFAEERRARWLVLDEALSPGQKAALEKWTGVTVWDRAFVIMKIFERRAVTAEARLQVQLALTRYELPQLKGLGMQMSRTGGGIGTRGPGETEFERHRRRLERRAKEISKKLDNVRKQRRLVRDRRRKRGAATVSLAGYTNSGKSTLLRALSGDASIVAADRLFSTLDTSVRRVAMPGGGAFLLSDTVGFIRHLPPELIAAFRATLEEIRFADLLLLVLDASDARALDEWDVVMDTLADIDCEGLPRLVVLNKVDAAEAADVEAMSLALRAGGEDVVRISALRGDGLGELTAEVERALGAQGQWAIRPVGLRSFTQGMEGCAGCS